MNENENHENWEYTVKNSGKRDILVRIISVFLAIIIWIYAVCSDGSITEAEYNSIPLEIANANILQQKYGYKIWIDSDFKVSLKLRGRQSDFNKLTPSDIYAYIDVGTVEAPGDYSLNILAEAPQYVTISSISPSYAQVYIDKFVNKILTVEIDLSKVVIQGYRIVSYTLTDYNNADSVGVTLGGPEKIVAQYSHARVFIEYDSNDITITEAGTVALEGTVIYTTSDGSEINNKYVTTSISTIKLNVVVEAIQK